MSTDPDSFVRSEGAEAMRAVIAGAVPIRAKLLHDVLCKGELPDRAYGTARWKMHESDLIEAAASILAIVSTVRRVELTDAQHELVVAERGVIALAMRGKLTRAKLAMIDETLFALPARSLAWLCVCKALASGPRATFHHARLALAYVPRLDFEPELWRDLVADTQNELDRAEAMELRLDHFAVMVNERRRKNATDLLLPVALELSKGLYSIDSAQRLREAASILEGA